ncbi:MAG TPA: aminoacetone oxidase family FAD-binding enzyme [Phycisphaerales bacterium]|nr:aminoacetone oxidase family FAD-binding enzyme [Phycisphaerales bacterium]HMP38455.1 aminoacetone oxidase family FAD-binding enzyme [Phycisphaerales bacterium]
MTHLPLTAAEESADIAIVGAGAAGLFAAIWAGRAAGGADGAAPRIVALDGARRLGAKILVAGGGRCNVTHFAVDERDFSGSAPAAIRRVLRRFPIERTIAFFESEGVPLKREPTGKLFPASDSARSVLDALLAAAERARVQIRHPWRVESIRRLAIDDAERASEQPGPPRGEPEARAPAAVRRRRLRADLRPVFRLRAEDGRTLLAQRVILATGGRSLPKSGSDGHGLEMARALGHSITPHVFPALVPLLLPEGHFIRSLSGIATEAIVEVRDDSGRRVASSRGSVLCAHFGLSGPAILDISRHLTAARLVSPGAPAQGSSAASPAGGRAARLTINWMPWTTLEALDESLRGGIVDSSRTLGQLFRRSLPERLADALAMQCGLDRDRSLRQLSREERRRVATIACALPLPIEGDRGWTHAEVTAGGVPLAEVDVGTMASRLVDGLFLCGEILDVDGRIGGFNFQWAWASGFVAGTAAAS